MAIYSKHQSTVIALWNLALQYGYDTHGYTPLKNSKAPELITQLVNSLGEEHSSESIVLHNHGYDQLLWNRNIDKSITNLQREIVKELLESGTVKKIYDR